MLGCVDRYGYRRFGGSQTSSSRNTIKTLQFVETSVTPYQSPRTWNWSLQQRRCKNLKNCNQYLSDRHTHTHTHTHTYVRKASIRYEYACARMCVYTYIHIRPDLEKYVHINTSWISKMHNHSCSSRCGIWSQLLFVSSFNEWANI